MADVLVQFETLVAGPAGSRWRPRACGRQQEESLWEAWIEFEPAVGGGRPVRTGHESIQPNRADLEYWAQGLTQTFLEGALVRALRGPLVPRSHDTNSTPYLREAASRRADMTGDQRSRAVLNPFAVIEQGEDVLVQELSAMQASRLRDIAVGYGFLEIDEAAGENAESLIATIISAVRKPYQKRTPRSERDSEASM